MHLYEIPISAPLEECRKMILEIGLKIYSAKLVSNNLETNQIDIRYSKDLWASLDGLVRISLKPMNEKATQISLDFYDGQVLSGKKLAEKILDPVLKKVRPAYVLQPVMCEKCGKESDLGEYYQFYYAVKVSQRREDYKQTYPTTSWTSVTNYRIEGPASVFICYHCVGIKPNWNFLVSSRDQWQAVGDEVAIRQRRAGLLKQGFDTFFTRKQSEEMTRETMKTALESYNKGNFDLALELCDSTSKRYSNWVDAFTIRGMIYHKRGNPKAALGEFNRAIELSQSGAYYLYRALCWHDLGETDKAVEDLKQVLNLPTVADSRKSAQTLLTKWGN